MSAPATSRPWSYLYDRRWRKRRERQLRAHPLCTFCLKGRGDIVLASIADHIVPHRGDPVLFAGPLQSLCKPCHDSAKQQLERSGFIRGCDLLGNPLDPGHPWNWEQQR